MKIKEIFTAIIISCTIQASAQWTEVNIPDSTKLTGVAFADESNGFVCGYNPSTDSGAYGYLWVTNNGGQTWGRIWSTRDIPINDVVLTPQVNNVWMIEDSGIVIKTDVYVFNVLVFQQLTSSSLKCGFAVSDSLFYCAGENGEAYRLSGSGADWDTLVTGTLETINDIYFSDAAHGWIVANGGYVATTSDSGTSWTFVQQPLWGFYDFNGIAYQGNSGMNPYIVGEYGQGLFSVDNGSNWFNFTTNTVTNLNKIRFGTTAGGLICGDDGFISRTIDGGGTWFTESSPRGADYNDISFASDTMAYICGDSGVVLKSSQDISGIRNNTASHFGASAFPNPFSGPLNLSLLVEENAAANIYVTDLFGQTVVTQNCPRLSTGVNQIEITGTENLAPGMYFLTVSSESGTITLPVIKQ